MTVRWTVRAAPGPPAGGESLIARHVVADCTCSRRRFLFLKKRAIPVAVPAFFGARSARLKNSTAATRSPPFSRHRRQSARSPSFRRSSSSEKRPFPPPRGFCPAGGALFLFSPMLASLAKGQSHSIGWRASRALLNSSFLIPHCPFLTPRPPCERGSNPRPARFAFFLAKRNLSF